MKIAILRQDGGVSVMHTQQELTDAQVSLEIIKWEKVCKPHKMVQWARIEEVPYDRFFRDQWTLENQLVKVDMGKAKEAWKNNWRKVREPLLQNLDIEFIKNLEVNDVDQLNEVKLKKQALRDVTKTSLAAVKDPEELKTVWPEILGPNPYVEVK